MIEFFNLSFPLTLEQVNFYSQFTTPEFFFLLKNIHPLKMAEGKVFALQASDKGIVVGLLLGAYIPIIEEGEILSIFIQPEYRNQEIGTQLFKESQKFLFSEGCKTLAISYQKEKEFTSFLEKILANLHWSSPKLHTVNLHFIVKEFHPKWYEKKYVLLEAVEIISWFDMTKKEKEFLIQMDLNQVIPSIVSPFHNNPELIEPLNSLVMRYQGQLVGWIVSKRIDQDTIQYSSLFFFPEWRNKGWFAPLLCQSIRLQQESLIPKAVLTINLEGTEMRWIHFIKTRLLPYAYKVERFYESSIIK